MYITLLLSMRKADTGHQMKRYGIKTKPLNTDMNEHFEKLKRDYESCGSPIWSDPMTIKTLDDIVYEIKLGRISLDDFYSFAKENIGQGDFYFGCWRYVRRNL